MITKGVRYCYRVSAFQARVGSSKSFHILRVHIRAVYISGRGPACMEASGWEVADDQVRATPASYTPPASFTFNAPVVTQGYTGDMKNGKRDGHGTLTYVDGSKYVGEFKDDVRSGHGVWTNVRGDHYEGEWANDRRNGFGVAVTLPVASGVDGRVERGILSDGKLVKAEPGPG